MNKKIYFSAPLFNARQNLFNAYLETKLDAVRYTTYFPQRDGFELGLLGDIIKKQLDPKDANAAAITIVYIFDLGRLTTQCDAVVANLDDPIDESVAVELAYAKFLNMPIVGFRTDVRSLFGTPTYIVSINCFPVYQCTSYLKLPVPTGIYQDVTKATDSAIQKIITQLQTDMAKWTKVIPNAPIFNQLLKAYHLLFDNIPNVHSPDSMKEIVSRYIKNKNYFASEMTALYDFSQD